MMKRLIVLGIVAVMVMGLSVAASATLDTKWVVQLRASDMVGANMVDATQFGAGTVSTANLGIKWLATSIGIYVAGTEADGRRYKDIRALADDTVLEVWDLTLEAGASYAGTQCKLFGWNPAGTAYDIDDTLADAPKAGKITLFNGNDVVWQFDPLKNGTSAAPQFSTTLDITAGQKISGLKLVYSVPEPGSMVALFSGLVGLVGYGIRRRK